LERKERYAHAHESNQHSLSSQVDTSIGLDITRSDTDDGYDELAEAHARRTDQEKFTATEAIDEGQSGKSHGGVDDVRDDGNDEWVGDTRRLEERGSVVD